MRLAQDLFFEAAALFVRARPNDVPANTMAMPAPGQQPPKPVTTANSLRAHPFVLWFAAVIAAIVVSLILILGALYMLGNVKLGIGGAVFVWAILIGWFFLFIAPAKLVTAAFGAIFGSGTQAAITGEGIVGQLKKLSSIVVEALGLISPQAVVAEQGFIIAMVWLFLGLVCVLCLPAFFKD